VAEPPAPPWTLIVTPRAEKDLRHVGADHAERVAAALDSMQADPRQGDVRKLTDVDNEWRRRVGNWRIRFTIDDTARAVVVLRVLPRGDAYEH
jgi:mRNA interferase RelE/StbE